MSTKNEDNKSTAIVLALILGRANLQNECGNGVHNAYKRVDVSYKFARTQTRTRVQFRASFIASRCVEMACAPDLNEFRFNCDVNVIWLKKKCLRVIESRYCDSNRLGLMDGISCYM